MNRYFRKMSSVWLESEELSGRAAPRSASRLAMITALCVIDQSVSTSKQARALGLVSSSSTPPPMVMCRGRLTILSDSANLSRLGMLFSSVVVAVTAVLSKIADVYIYSDCAVRYPLRYGTRKLLKPHMTNDLRLQMHCEQPLSNNRCVAQNR